MTDGTPEDEATTEVAGRSESDLLPCPKCGDDIDVGPSYEGQMISYDCECGEGPETMCLTHEEAIKEWNEYVRNAS